ncbi:hypothetical protein V8E36_009652 [Tilletia maclaganii]
MVVPAPTPYFHHDHLHAKAAAKSKSAKAEDDDESSRHKTFDRPRAPKDPSTHLLTLGYEYPYGSAATFMSLDLPELYRKITAAKAHKVPIAILDFSGLDMSGRDSPIVFELLAQPPAWFLSPSVGIRRTWASKAITATTSGPKDVYGREEDPALPPAFTPDDIEFPIRRIEAVASNITSDSLQALTTFVRGNPSLNEISIPQNQIGVYSAIPLASFASSMRWSNIRTLTLSRNVMAPATFCAFLRNLESTSLRALALDGVLPTLENQKDRIECARAIASFLRPRISQSAHDRENAKPALACPRLDRIWLGDNDLSFHGVQLVVAAIIGLPVCHDIHKKEIQKLEDSKPHVVAAARAAAKKPFAERSKAEPNRSLVTAALPYIESSTNSFLDPNNLWASIMPPEVLAAYERTATTAQEGRQREEDDYRKLHKCEEEDGMLGLITPQNYTKLVSARLQENLWGRSEKRLGASQLLRAARILGCEPREGPGPAEFVGEKVEDEDAAWIDDETSWSGSLGSDDSVGAVAMTATGSKDASKDGKASEKPFPFFRLPPEIRLNVLRQLPYVNLLSHGEFDRVLRFACDRRTIGYGSTSAIGAPDGFTLARYLPQLSNPTLIRAPAPTPSPLASGLFSFENAYRNLSQPRDWPAEMLDYSTTPQGHGEDCTCGQEYREADPWRIELRPDDKEEKRHKERKRRDQARAALAKQTAKARAKAAKASAGKGAEQSGLIGPGAKYASYLKKMDGTKTPAFKSAATGAIVNAPPSASASTLLSKPGTLLSSSATSASSSPAAATTGSGLNPKAAAWAPGTVRAQAQRARRLRLRVGADQQLHPRQLREPSPPLRRPRRRRSRRPRRPGPGNTSPTIHLASPTWWAHPLVATAMAMSTTTGMAREGSTAT